MWLRINLSLCKTQSITDFRSCGRNMVLGLQAHSLSLVEKKKKKKTKNSFLVLPQNTSRFVLIEMIWIICPSVKQALFLCRR